MGQGGGCCRTEAGAGEELPGSVELYGVTVSSNCMGALLLITEKKLGRLVPTMPGPDGTRRPEFLAMNPFHAVPTLKDGSLVVAESNAILRYLATKYAPQLYPVSDPKRRGYIDWAMENFAGTPYQDAQALIYPCLGFASPPADREAAAKSALDNLTEYTNFFLREKFVGGDKLSIADYKIAPFLYCYTHQMLLEQGKFKCPDRVKQYVKDFVDACPSSNLLSSADGMSLKEVLDAKRGSPGGLATPSSTVKIEASDLIKAKARGSGKVKLFGAPPSGNALGPTLVGMDLQCIEMVPTMPGQDTRTEEFLAMNPFHAIPTLKDGDYTLAESSAIMRYLATNHGPELYPTDPGKRARVDWAIDNFATTLYPDAPKTLYACLGFMDFPPDTKDVGRGVSDKLQEFADYFLRDTKFIAGNQLTIADYKVAPFFYAWGHPMLADKCAILLPARIAQFNTQFAASSKSSGMFLSAGGYALKEILDKRYSETK
mmetsp:Transcript_66724/g.192779  ORF Transcript_66724/g.192779 Transcript_66724/m.192779 type:complete len:487 (-) Transcript_66724:45-1505(-)